MRFQGALFCSFCRSSFETNHPVWTELSIFCHIFAPNLWDARKDRRRISIRDLWILRRMSRLSLFDAWRRRPIEWKARFHMGKRDISLKNPQNQRNSISAENWEKKWSPKILIKNPACSEKKKRPKTKISIFDNYFILKNQLKMRFQGVILITRTIQNILRQDDMKACAQKIKSFFWKS